MMEALLRSESHSPDEGQRRISPRADSEPAPLSFAQQRLWFLAQLQPDSPLYNVPRTISLRGPLNVQALECALHALIERHETLRTTFPVVDGKPVQLISPPSP